MNYTPIRLSTLKAGIAIPFSLFIYFKDQYLEYSENGMSFDVTRFRKLKKQRVAKFYITDKDEKNYQKFLDDILNETLSSSETSLSEKIDLARGAASTAVERMQDDPTSQTSYQITRSAAKKLRELIFSDPEALKSIFGNSDENDLLIKHSLNVCALSIKFGERLKLKEEDLDDLATAALMHDIGISQLSADEQKLFEKPPEDFTSAEKVRYWAHCDNTLQVLQDKPYIGPSVIELIRNHEENRAGTGPHKKSKLNLSEEILSLVNCYDRRVSVNKMTAADALKSMMIDDLGNYELPILQKFEALIKSENL